MRLGMLILCLVTGSVSVAQADGNFVKVIIKGQDCYMVSEAQAGAAFLFADACMATPAKKDSFWTLDVDSIEKADVANRKLIERGRSNLNLAFPDIAAHRERYARNANANALNELGLVYKNLKDYSGQFVGFIVDGKKRIFCNYFRRERLVVLNIDPSTKFVVVCDGGYDFWQVVYDVETNKCMNLAINGPWQLDY